VKTVDVLLCRSCTVGGRKSACEGVDSTVHDRAALAVSLEPREREGGVSPRTSCQLVLTPFQRCFIVQSMSTEELPGMPAATAPAVGSREWRRSEWKRFQKLAAQHDGLTYPIVACALLGVSRQRVYQLMDTGRLVWYEVLGHKMLACDQLEAFASLDRRPGFRYTAEVAV
jgi:hypothetical protein